MPADERRPRDVNSLAARIVAEATGEAEKTEAPTEVISPASPRETRA